MNREQRRKAKRNNLYEEVTGKKFLQKKIPLDAIVPAKELKQLDEELLNKIEYFYVIQETMGKEARIFYNLMISYLDSLCSLNFVLLDEIDKSTAREVMEIVANYTSLALKGCTFSHDIHAELVDSIRNMAHFSLKCFEGSQVPLIMPLLDNAAKCVDYSYVLAGVLYHNLNGGLSKKDADYVRDIVKFTEKKTNELMPEAA